MVSLGGKIALCVHTCLAEQTWSKYQKIGILGNGHRKFVVLDYIGGSRTRGYQV